MMIQRATHPLKKTILKCVHNSTSDDTISDTSKEPGCSQAAQAPAVRKKKYLTLLLQRNVCYLTAYFDEKDAF